MTMMNRISIGLLMAVILAGCQKVNQDTNQVLTGLKLTTYQMDADGTATDTVTVQLNANADATRRNVRFSASPYGKWIGGDSTISVKAVFQNNLLIARAVFLVSNTPGNIQIQARPDLPDVSNNNYTQSANLVTKTSNVSVIKLTPSGFGINSNYLSEVTLTGTLTNAKGFMAVAGTNVVFEDTLAGGGPAGGSFRTLVTASNASSQVSAIYSVGTYPIGTKVTIRVTVLDATGAKTTISDNIQLTINK